MLLERTRRTVQARIRATRYRVSLRERGICRACKGEARWNDRRGCYMTHCASCGKAHSDRVRRQAQKTPSPDCCDVCGSLRLVKVKGCVRCEACGYKGDCNGW